MFWPDGFLAKLPKEPTLALDKMTEQVVTRVGPHAPLSYEDCIDVLLAFRAISDAHDLKLPFPEVRTLSGRPRSDAVVAFVRAVRNETDDRLTADRLREAEQKYRTLFGTTVAVEFTLGDIEVIQGHIDALRRILTSSTTLSDGHRDRLLDRLEALQRELHRRMSSADKFWAFFGDAMIAVRRFGEASEPYHKLLIALAKLFLLAQARAADLPSGCEPPALPPAP